MHTPASSSSTPPSSANNPALPFLQIFERQRGVALVLSAELHILAATDAYLQEVQIPRDQLLNRYLFDVFPRTGRHSQPRRLHAR